MSEEIPWSSILNTIPQNFNHSDPRRGKSVDGVGEYIEDIRRLPLDSSVKDGMLGHTAASLLNIAQ